MSLESYEEPIRCKFGKNRCQGPLACERLLSAITVAVSGSIGVVLGFEWSERQAALGRDVPIIELIFVTLLIIFVSYIIVGLTLEYLRRVIDHRWLNPFSVKGGE